MRVQPLFQSSEPALLGFPSKSEKVRCSLTPLHMKKYFVGWLRGTLLAALFLFAAQAARAHDHGGSMGSHFSGSHNFAFHGDHDHFFHGDHDRFFHHDHDRFFRHRFFFGFGFPYWYPYYYPYYPYDYGYYDNAGLYYSGQYYSDQYYSDLTAAVQTELARDGYYHGPVNGVVSSDTVSAIRAYRKAKGLPVTGQIDRRLLRSLSI